MMKNVLFMAVLAIFILSCSEKGVTDYVSIFDGETWAGWEGSKDFFRIEDGAIVAGSADQQIPLNQFLCTEKTYSDFDLKMKVKFTSNENNAGIQFRTARIPDQIITR